MEIGQPAIHALNESGPSCRVLLSQAMAIELGEHGVRCNAIAPGIFESDITQVRPGSVQCSTALGCALCLSRKACASIRGNAFCVTL